MRCGILFAVLASASQYGVEALLLNAVNQNNPHPKVQCGPGIESQCRSLSSLPSSQQKGKAKWNSRALNDYLDSKEFADFRVAAMRKTTRPVFFTHLLKAGGSHLNVLFHKVFGKGHGLGGDTDSAIYARDNATHPDDYFRIGVTRSPCDYMLSVWAFQQGCPDCHVGQFDCADSGQVLRPNCHSGHFCADSGAQLKTNSSIQAFRKWVVEQGALQSFRLWQASVDEPTSCNNCQMACFMKHDGGLRGRVLSYFQHNDMSERYDCLLHTENLSHEFEACINKYISEQSDEHTKATLSQRLQFALKSAKGIVNKGPDILSKARYFDTKTLKYIWNREKYQARSAGYTSCLS